MNLIVRFYLQKYKYEYDNNFIRNALYTKYRNRADTHLLYGEMTKITDRWHTLYRA